LKSQSLLLWRHQRYLFHQAFSHKVQLQLLGFEMQTGCACKAVTAPAKAAAMKCNESAAKQEWSLT
jgi:hypothetical protein